MNRTETINKMYDLEGDLLDTSAEAALNERPFYMQKRLDDIKDQCRLIEHITDESRRLYEIYIAGENEDGCGNDADLYDYARGG